MQDTVPGSLEVEISVVVPVMNEEDNVRPLAEEIVAGMAGEAFELLFVDDCSADRTVQVLQELAREIPQLRPLKHDTNCGQSSAVRTGVLHAKGGIVGVLDGDGQNDPADFPALLKALRDPSAPDNLMMVGGERQKRKDTPWKRFASKAGNGIRRKMLRDKGRDAGCGIKVFHREAFLRLPYFDHMHRYMAALMLREGFEVHFVPVNHRPRTAGSSKYGVLDRLWVSISDVMGVMWLRRRARLPQKVDEI